jgi:NAD(P)H-nitrite reductase large subunit
LLATGVNPQGGLAADAGLAMQDGRVRVTADMPTSNSTVFADGHRAEWSQAPGFWSTIGDHTLKYAA